MIVAASRRYPLLTAVIIVLGVTMILIGPLFFVGPIDVTGGTGRFDFDTLTSGITFQALLTLALLMLVVLLRWRDITSLAGPIDRRGWRAFFTIAIYPVLGLAFGISQILSNSGDETARTIITTVLMLNALIGISEELLFRGFLFGALREKHRLITAILISSLAFGMLHLVNAASGQSVEQTLFQIISATALGLLFCALVLQCNSLWPAVLLHMLWNSFIMLNLAAAETRGDLMTQIVETSQTPIQAVVLPACITIIAIVMLRNFTKRTGTSLFTVLPSSAPHR